MHVAWQAYDDASAQYFEAYESLTFTKAHRALNRFLPPKGAMCLDVGSGSGRDAAALARRGYNVVAVEPSNKLRTLAQQHHRSPRIEWIDDALPDLEKVKLRRHKYEFILLSAVWMHVPPGERVQSLATLAGLLSDNGYIALTLRIGLPSPDREMYEVTVNELLHHAELVGLQAKYVSRNNKDSLKRNEVSWRKVVLAKMPIESKVNSPFAS